MNWSVSALDTSPSLRTRAVASCDAPVRAQMPEGLDASVLFVGVTYDVKTKEHRHSTELLDE